MRDALKEAVLEEIKAYYEQNTLQPGDVTAKEIAELIGRSKETARTLLQRMIKEGKMTKVVMTLDGHRRMVYRKV